MKQVENTETDRSRRVGALLARVRKALPASQRLSGGVEHGSMSVAAALVAYLPTRALGFHEGFWAAITAIAVVQTEYHATRTTARDQFTGAAIGGIVSIAIVTLIGESLTSYALAVVVAIVSAWLLNAMSAARLAGTTATIVLLVPHQGVSPIHMMAARVSEVGWGVSVAISVVWLFSKAASIADAMIHGGRAVP